MKRLYNWFTNKLWCNPPTCICGFNMRPNYKNKTYPAWKCFSSCMWESYQTFNGTIHWCKKWIK